MPGALDGGVVLITGASSGLGEGLAEALARRGARIGLMARRAGELGAIAERIRQAGGVAEAAPCDVTDRAAVEGAVSSLTALLGPADVMVACAGAGVFTPATAFRAEDFEQVVRINLLGVIFTFGAVIPAMLDRGQGHLVAVSSIAGYRGLPRHGAYCASKAGVSALCESLRMEIDPHGIRVTTIHPGFVRTPMTAKNKFPMPFLLDRDRAVEIMARGIERRARRVDFPWQLDWVARLGRLLPEPLWGRVTGARSQPPRLPR